MSLLDMFSPKPKAPEGNQGSQPPANTATQPNGLPNPGNPTPEAPAPQNNNNSKNPLDAFSGIWDNKDNQEAEIPKFNLPEEALGKVVSSQDFLSGIDQELVSKALGGDPKSFLAVIQEATRAAYKTSMQHMSTLSDRFIDSRLAHQSNQLGSRIKSELTNQELSSSTNNFNHEAVRPLLVNIAKEFSKKYPDASPQAIATMAKDYLQQVTSAVTGTQESTKQNEPKEVDWENFLRG